MNCKGCIFWTRTENYLARQYVDGSPTETTTITNRPEGVGNYVYERTLEPSKFGICKCPKVTEGSPTSDRYRGQIGTEGNDELFHEYYEGGCFLTTGQNFGCIHFKGHDAI